MHATNALLAPEIVGERYQLAEAVGEGNFAVTYRAHDLVLERTVAVKMLRPQYAADESFVSRFEQEARMAAAVVHPNVVDVYDYGAHAGTFYIVMQYVPGRTLKDELDARGRLPAADAVRIASQVLHGLAAIHAAGIIHRDIKPQNVLFGRDGVARVTDFGVAHDPVAQGLTSHGTTLGTASYMAPEQARGGELSEATDLYAVGVVLFELLTGRLPFTSDNPMTVMLAHLEQAPPRVRDLVPPDAIPPALDAEVARALAKNPADRPPGAMAMAEALESTIDWDDASVPVRPEPGTAGTATAPLTLVAPTGEPRPDATVAAESARAPDRTRGVAPGLVPPRPRRRLAAWVAPLALFALAIASLGGVIAAGGVPGLPSLSGDDGDGEGRGAPVAALAETTATVTPENGTPLPTPTPRSVRRLVPLDPAPTATEEIVSLVPLTATPAPTATPEPTATATATPSPTATPTAEPTPTETPVPTPTPSPTATPEPTPIPTAVPTATPTPAPVVLDDPDPEVVEEGPPAAGTGEDGGSASTLNFGATDWRNAFAEGDQSWYGRPWVAVYGADSPYSRATLRFDLGQEPEENLSLTVTGLGDETGSPFPFAVEVNGRSLGEIPASFPNWNPARDGSEGQNASWGRIEIEIPGTLFEQGGNEISIVSLQPGANVGVPPYLLLSEATLELPDPGSTSDLGDGFAPVRLGNAPESDADADNSGPGNSRDKKKDKNKIKNKDKGDDDDDDDD